MSDIGKVSRKPGTSPFPVKRRSTEPLQPESGEAEFSEDLKTFDEESTGIVHGSDKADQAIVREEVRRKKLQKKMEPRKHEDEQDTEEEEDKKEEAGGRIDLEA